MMQQRIVTSAPALLPSARLHGGDSPWRADVTALTTAEEISDGDSCESVFYAGMDTSARSPSATESV